MDMNKKIEDTAASKMVVDNLRRYMPELPDRITVRQACKYAVLMRAMDGEMAAYKEAFKDEPKKESKEDLEKELLKIGNYGV